MLKEVRKELLILKSLLKKIASEEDLQSFYDINDTILPHQKRDIIESGKHPDELLQKDVDAGEINSSESLKVRKDINRTTRERKTEEDFSFEKANQSIDYIARNFEKYRIREILNDNISKLSEIFYKYGYIDGFLGRGANGSAYLTTKGYALKIFDKTQELNDEKLSNEMLFTNSYGAKNEVRIYETGDLITNKSSPNLGYKVLELLNTDSLEQFEPLVEDVTTLIYRVQRELRMDTKEYKNEVTRRVIQIIQYQLNQTINEDDAKLIISYFKSGDPKKDEKYPGDYPNIYDQKNLKNIENDKDAIQLLIRLISGKKDYELYDKKQMSDVIEAILISYKTGRYDTHEGNLGYRGNVPVFFDR